MFTGRKKRDALGDIVCNHINTTLTGHVQNGKLSLSTVDTPTITYHSGTPMLPGGTPAFIASSWLLQYI